VKKIAQNVAQTGVRAKIETQLFPMHKGRRKNYDAFCT
jgi:hypothetical protein